MMKIPKTSQLDKIGDELVYILFGCLGEAKNRGAVTSTNPHFFCKKAIAWMM